MGLRELKGPKREKVARDWRNCVIKREKRKTHRVLVWKPEGQGSHQRPKHRWEDNIKMGLKERGLEGME